MTYMKLVGVVAAMMVVASCKGAPVQNEPPTTPSAKLTITWRDFGPKVGANAQPYGYDRFTVENSNEYYVFRENAYYLLPGRPVTVEVMGRRAYSIPIVAMTSAIYEVKGRVTFTPVVDHHYEVKGVLSEERSAVWIEDKSNGEVVGEKVEVKGSAAIGFFEK